MITLSLIVKTNFHLAALKTINDIGKNFKSIGEMKEQYVIDVLRKFEKSYWKTNQFLN